MPGFVDEWQALYEACPWATPFQSPKFVTAWYECYRDEQEPIVVAWLGSESQLLCLLTLAQRRGGRLICGAGAQQACCQVWLALEESVGFQFLREAWVEIKHAYATSVIRLRYLPFSVGQEELNKAFLARIARTHDAIQHVILLDAEHVDATINKKQNKKRLRKLAERGSVELTSLPDIPDSGSFLAEMASQGDLNKGAGYGVSAFQEDPAKMPFHLRLLRSRQILRGAALTVNGQLAAGGVCLVGHGRAYHILSSYSPIFGEFSPSRILLMGLTKTLADEGFTELLPSPGDDEWKRQTSDEVRHVSELTLSPSAAAAKWTDLCAFLRAAGKRVLGFAGLQPDRLRGAASKGFALARKMMTPQHAISIPRQLWRHVELRVYLLDLAEIEPPTCPGRFRKNSIQDLVCFEPGEKWQSRQQFLRSASQRLQAGETAYTYGEHGRLFHCTWLVPLQEKTFLNAVGMEFVLPPGTAVLYDAYTDPSQRGRGLYRDCIRQILIDLTDNSNASKAMMCVQADNGPSRHVIESLGFRYDCSLHYARTPFSVRRWRSSSP
jgi:CelD/BcsL family acetyltransferase involved in cellulose biosynthesis/ribosomal protein S18 acetylase RimI-like enzyme